MATNTPQCFISYSWDSPEHRKWVRNLASNLQEQGIETRLDQWDLKPGQDMMEFMEFSIQTSDFVLLICTPNYCKKANDRKGGVGYEKSIITGEIFYSIEDKAKFIPLLTEGELHESLPIFLKSKMYIDFRKASDFEEQFEELIRHIYNTPKFPKPQLGNKPQFVNPLKTTSVDKGQKNVLLFDFTKVTYKLMLPLWWDKINVDLSKEQFNKDYTIHDFISKNFSTEVGTKENWKHAFKAYALFYHSTNGFPVFLAHSAKEGQDFELAIKIYTELYNLVDLYGQKEDWYHSYLGYCAGTVYQQLGQYDLASVWYKKSGDYQGHEDSAIKYYANLSLTNMKTMRS